MRRVLVVLTVVALATFTVAAQQPMPNRLRRSGRGPSSKCRNWRTSLVSSLA